MSASGIIKEFSIKSGLFEFTSKLEDKIQNVQTDVVESKRDLEDKINALNQNLNQSIQSMSSKIDTKITSSANQNQFTNIDIGSLFREFSERIEKGKIERIKDARIGNKLESSKVSLPAGVKEDIEKYDDLQQKLREIQQLLERLSPIDIEQTLKEANYYYYAGNYKEALRRYDDILKQDPNQIDALVNKGMVHYRLGEYEKARVCFSQALNLEPGNFDASIYKAMLFYKTGKIEEAKRYYKKAIGLKIDENNIDALVNKGIAYEHLGDQSEAKSYFQKVIESEIDPQSGDGLVNKGIAFDKLGKYEDARDYYTRALKIDKENVFAQYSYARSYALEGKIDNCLDILEEIVEKHPQYKERVKDDPDFKNIKSSERFRKLIGTILP